MDEMVLETQQWLNATYKGKIGWEDIPETGVTGWTTVYALLHAFQIENGSTTPSDNIGNWTITKINEVGLIDKDANATPSNIVKILQGTLWCKGYPADGITGVFGDQTELGVKRLKEDIGIDASNAKLSLYLWYALFSMDQFVMLPNGKDYIRDFQQYFNSTYSAYYDGYVPCDGLSGRELYTCFVYVLQKEEGFHSWESSGSFGDQTYANCPTISTLVNYSNYPDTIKCIKIALNISKPDSAYGDLVIDSILNSGVFAATHRYEEFMCIDVATDDVITKETIKSLFTSNGDTSRKATACDMATPVDESIATALLSAGYKAVGRYLTYGIIDGKNKQLTKGEIAILNDKGINIIPIYQTSGNSVDYFDYNQGVNDANDAVNLAFGLKIKANTIIYFAVDFDVLGGDIPYTVIPYFQGINDVLTKSVYKVGIYGTRNVCLQVSKAGYAQSSYLSDMSYGYSGNLGFTAPSNWSFDQFAGSTLEVKNGQNVAKVPIDKVTYRNNVVGKGDAGIMSKPDSLENAKLQYCYDVLGNMNLLPAALEYDFSLTKSPTIALAPWLTVNLAVKSEVSIKSNSTAAYITIDENGKIKEWDKVDTALKGINGMNTMQRQDVESFFNSMALNVKSGRVGTALSILPGTPMRMKLVFSFESEPLDYVGSNLSTSDKVVFEVTFEYTAFNELLLYNVDLSPLAEYTRYALIGGFIALGSVALVTYVSPYIAIASVPTIVDGAVGVVASLINILRTAIE